MSIDYEKIFMTVSLLDIQYNVKTKWYFGQETVDMELALKCNPHYTMKYTFEKKTLGGGDGSDITNLIWHECHQSLLNRWNEDHNKFGDYLIDDPVDFSIDYEINQDYDPTYYVTYYATKPYVNSFTFSGDSLILSDDDPRLVAATSNTTFISTTNPNVCPTCADTGYIDCSIYGSYECPHCSSKEEKPEKEVSAWDKKLKEELDNGDDTWGSIAKKYKK